MLSYVKLFALYNLIAKTCHCIHCTPKIMVQFCHLGIDTVSCRLLLRMARMHVDLNLKELGQLFHVHALRTKIDSAP